MSKGSEKSSGKKKNPQLPPEIEDKFKNVTIGIIAPTNVCYYCAKTRSGFDRYHFFDPKNFNNPKIIVTYQHYNPHIYYNIICAKGIYSRFIC
jgi:hypothetical protein